MAHLFDLKWRMCPCKRYSPVYEKNDVIVWEPNEVIYKVDDVPSCAYLIIEGAVMLYTREGLQLNQIGSNEILGETSLLLEKNRTVTAISGSTGAQAKRIPARYFTELTTRDKVVAALIRKVQYRLIDSNLQSNNLAVNLDRITELVEMQVDKLDPEDRTVIELLDRLKAVHQKVVFARDIIAYPQITDDDAQFDQKNQGEIG